MLELVRRVVVWVDEVRDELARPTVVVVVRWLPWDRPVVEPRWAPGV